MDNDNLKRSAKNVTDADADADAITKKVKIDNDNDNSYVKGIAAIKKQYVFVDK